MIIAKYALGNKQRLKMMAGNAFFTELVYNQGRIITTKADVTDPIFTEKRPDFPYGWIVVAASTLVMYGFYGVDISFGVFLKPILEEFNWTRALTSGATSIAKAIGGLFGIVTGRLTDRYGARMVIAFGGLAGGIGCLLISRVSSLWQLYFFYGVMVGILLSASWVPINATVSKWFREKRILAMGITNSGITVGQMSLPPLMAYFVTTRGWRFAYVVLAIIVWITAIPAIIGLGKKPPPGIYGSGIYAKSEHSPEGETGNYSPEWSAAEAAKTVPFWMLVITGCVTAIGLFSVTVHIIAYATDLGIATTSAALILTCMGGADILSKIFVWRLASRIGTRLTLFLLMGLQTLALFLFGWAASLWTLLALALLFGFGFGANATIRMSMVPEFFGVKSAGAIIGFTTVAWAAGGIIGPILAGYLFDISHSYRVAFSVSGLLMITGMVATYFLKAPKRQTTPMSTST